MKQRIFDIDNEKDMADLWDILPDMVKRIEKEETDELNPYHRYMTDDFCLGGCRYINIDFHDKKEITRPIKEATEADIGKICKFWSIEKTYIGELIHIENTDTGKYYEMSAPIAGNLDFLHCRRLTKQEIEELC